MRTRQPKPENSHYFALYKEKGIFLSLSRQFSANFIAIGSKEAAEGLLNDCVLPHIIYEEAILALSDVMTDHGLNKFRTQFRQFKARTKSGTKHLALREETYNKIIFLAQDFDDIEQFFEYLLDPEMESGLLDQLKNSEGG